MPQTDAKSSSRHGLSQAIPPDSSGFETNTEAIGIAGQSGKWKDGCVRHCSNISKALPKKSSCRCPPKADPFNARRANLRAERGRMEELEGRATGVGYSMAGSPRRLRTKLPSHKRGAEGPAPSRIRDQGIAPSRYAPARERLPCNMSFQQQSCGSREAS